MKEKGNSPSPGRNLFVRWMRVILGSRKRKRPADAVVKRYELRSDIKKYCRQHLDCISRSCRDERFAVGRQDVGRARPIVHWVSLFERNFACF